MIKKFQTVLHDHTPANKLRHQVTDSFCTVEIKSYDGSNKNNPNAWVEIFLTEYYTPTDGNRVMSRKIMATLDAGQREKLLKILLD